jgi:DNA gyrase subunit A
METTSEKNHINIEDEMRRSYLDYAMSVIIGRALPDIRDGLKPVHRRVMWAMHELGNTYNKPYKKSARIVGDVIGKYHPHGDVAVYDTIVRLAQDFSMRYPLIDGQGNFGSVDGDAAAAMRYTEIRMSRLTNELLADIEKETVDHQPNYDDSQTEPKVLPARVPNLLINGSDGIAVGMATKIAPHNLTEVVDATLALLKDPDIPIEGLTKIVTGPDFPTGGFIYGREEIRKSYMEGRGVIQLRARAGIDRIGRGTQERDAIVITEIPFQVNKARLIERIAELVNEKKLDGISDLA